jgi:cytoskeleton protein RodZ
MGYSIEQISQAINVRPSFIKAIEDGKFFGLTDPLYLKGFIRSYAKQVGLNDDEILPFFRREYDAQEHQQKLRQPLAPIQTRKSRLTPGWLVVAFLVISVLGALGYAYQQYVSVALTPQLQIETPTSEVKTASDQIDASGHTDPDAVLSLNGQKLQIDPEGNFSTTIGLASGKNELIFKATNKLGRSATITRTVISTHVIAQAIPSPTVLGSTASAQASQSGKPQQRDPTADTKPLTIQVVIGPSPAWLEIATDGQDSFSGILLPGATKTFTADSRIHLKSGNAGSTRVTLSGKDQGVLGPDNQIAERDYTK